MSIIDLSKKFLFTIIDLFKKFLFNQFLKYQYKICTTGDKLPWSHALAFTILTYSFESIYPHLLLYALSIFYIGISVWLAKSFPDSFGKWYWSFLRQNSSPGVFDKYCGNPGGNLEGFASGVRAFVKAGGLKLIKGTVFGFGTEHFLSTMVPVHQPFIYEAETFKNGGVHPSGKPFEFKNRLSLLERALGARDS